MKNVSSALAAHIESGQTTLTYLWKVRRTDGVVMGFTSFDTDIDFDLGDGDGLVSYKASTGLLGSAVSNKSDLSVDNLEVTAFLDSEAITEEHLRANVYDDSDIKHFLLNWNDLTMGVMMLRRGTLGVVKIVNGKYTAELRGLAHKLSTQLGTSFGPICRAEFGSGLNGIDQDNNDLCMVDVAAYRQTGQVAGGPTATQFTSATPLLKVGSPTPTDPAPTGWFADGLVTFTTGENAGLSFEIKTYDAGLVTLFLPLPFPLVAGDEFTIEPGCAKTAGDCTNKFNNIINFRGEPFIPGMDRFLNGIGGGLGRG